MTDRSERLSLCGASTLIHRLERAELAVEEAARELALAEAEHGRRRRQLLGLREEVRRALLGEHDEARSDRLWRDGEQETPL